MEKAAGEPFDRWSEREVIAPLQPTVGTATAFDKSPALRDMEMIAPGGPAQPFSAPAKTDRSLVGRVANTRHKPDGALQSGLSPNAMPSPLFTFEGPRNEDNFNLFGIRVNPPDPNGDVGQHHYIATINLAFSIYTKTGTLLYGPADIGSLWQGFDVPDCSAGCSCAAGPRCIRTLAYAIAITSNGLAMLNTA